MSQDDRTNDPEERILELLANAEDQQLSVKAAIEGLAIERAAYAKERIALTAEREKLARMTSAVKAAAEHLVVPFQEMLAKTPEVAARAASTAVTKALGNVADTTTQAANLAAKPTIESFRMATEAAQRARGEIGATVAAFKSEWRRVVWGGGVLALLTVGLMAAAFLLLAHKELDDVDYRRAKVQEEINALDAQTEQGRKNPARKPGK